MKVVLIKLTAVFTFTITFCLLFQSAVAIYLLKETRKSERFDWQLRNFLLLLLVHISVKFLLLFIIKSDYPYGTIATGFSLFYAPYFLLITKGILHQPVTRKGTHLHLLPFYIVSAVFLFIICSRLFKTINDDGVIVYNDLNLIATMVSFIVYGIIIKRNLKASQDINMTFTRALQIKLVNNMISVMLCCGLVVAFLKMAGLVYPALDAVDTRMIIYLHLLMMPMLVIRYRLRSVHKEIPVSAPALLIREHEPNIQIEETTAKKYQKSGVDDSQFILYEEKIVKHMKKAKPFLNADLSLEDLAKQIAIPKHHLTQTLNDKIEKSFYQFINEYRIEEAVIRLKKNKDDVSLLSLAFDVGFNSKSSFNTYFKKITGHTPSSYRKSVLLLNEKV